MEKKYLDGFEDLTELEDFDDHFPTFDVYLIEMERDSDDPTKYVKANAGEVYFVAHFTDIDEGRNFAEELYEDPRQVMKELNITKPGVYSIQLLTIVDEIDVDCTYKRLVEIN